MSPLTDLFDLGKIKSVVISGDFKTFIGEPHQKFSKVAVAKIIMLLKIGAG